jgi:hypothetical protein
MLPITPQQREVLNFLKTVPHATNREATDSPLVSSKAVSSQTRALLGKGYVAPVPVDDTPDKSPYRFAITEAGLAVLTYTFAPVVNTKLREGRQVFGSADLQQKKERKVTGPGFTYQPYVPSPLQSVRPGADDHLQYKSRGV